MSVIDELNEVLAALSSNGKKQLASGWREASTWRYAHHITRSFIQKTGCDDRTLPAGKIPILRATNIDDGKLNFTGLVYVPQEYVSTSPTA